MADTKNEGKRLHPPQWLGRPILDDSHIQDLETRAAVNEFHSKMPRADAERAAHEEYVKEQRERAAAHHLAGMKAAEATGNHEDARKHWALYDLHLKALGKESIGSIPPEVEKRMSEDQGQAPVYKFKAHKGDLYALHQPTTDVAPVQGQTLHGPQNIHGQELPINAAGWPAGTESWAVQKAEKTCKHCGNNIEYKTGHLTVVKSEAKQCKWRLGERRCKRMVTTDYCHDHVDHWANKIKQRDGGLEKAALPPAGTAHLQAPPQLHSDMNGFMTGLKALPKGSPERGKFITAHMNHAPFQAALQAHPQGQQIRSMLNQHLNGTQNAGFKPGATVAVAKSEHEETLETALELILAVDGLLKRKTKS
jgi:hypothetical protein